MNDVKNILLAWISASSSVVAAIETKTVITIVSAIILPVLFFAIGKSIDVAVQFHFRNRERNRGNGEEKR